MTASKSDDKYRFARPGDELQPSSYTKLPVTIQAIRWSGTNLRAVIDFIGRHPSADDWTWEHFEEVVRTKGLKIFTLEGHHMASVGDYIIKGVHGEAYPCKPDIFWKTYQRATAPLPETQPREGDDHPGPIAPLKGDTPRTDARWNELYDQGGNTITWFEVAERVRALARLLEPFARAGNARVYLERVQPMPSIPGAGGVRRSMGASSAFAFGMSYWGAACVVAALAIELHLVHPQTWKAHFKLKKDKEMARALAIRWYPDAPLGRKKDQGRAEALLIARYGKENGG